MEIAALEEALPDVLHATLHLGLVLGFPHPRRIGDETPVLRVFQEALGEARMQRVWSRHRWRAIVDDQILGHPAEADPRRFQSGDDVLQRLPMGRPNEAVPRVSQHDDQPPHRPPASRLWIHNHAQPAEVHLRHLPGRGVLHPHRGLAAPSPIPLQDEAAQRRIRYRTPPRCQQLPDAGQLQPVAGEPLVNLVRPRLQQVLPGPLHLPRPRLPNRRQPAQLLRGGNQPIPNDALLLGCCHVLGDGISRQAGAQRNLALAIPRLPTANDLWYFHSGNLPVRHRCTSIPKCGNDRRCGSQSGLMTLKIWWVDPEKLPIHWPIDPEQ